MDFSIIKSLSDDDLREQLESNGYYPPPITDDAVRELMRRKLFKFLNPGVECPTNEVRENSSDDGDKDRHVDVHQRHSLGAGDTTATTASSLHIRAKAEEVQHRRSKFPIIVAIGFVILNILLAATIIYRDLLF